MGVTGTLKSLPRIVRMGNGEIDGENGKNPAWMLTSGQERTLMFAHRFDPFRISKLWGDRSCNLVRAMLLFYTHDVCIKLGL